MRLVLFFKNIKVLFEFLMRKIFKKMHSKNLNFSMTKFNNIDKSIYEKIDELNVKGYTIIENFIKSDRASYLRSKSYDFINNEAINIDHKSYFIELTKCKNSLQLKEICYNLKLNNLIRFIAYEYLGLGYSPEYSEIVYMPLKNLNQDYQESQLWHLDYESKKKLKVFILISNNISIKPIKNLITKEKTKKIFPLIKNLFVKNKHIHNNDLDLLAKDLNLKSGDLLILDASKCFHRYDKKTNSDLIIYTAQYIPF